MDAASLIIPPRDVLGAQPLEPLLHGRGKGFVGGDRVGPLAIAPRRGEDSYLENRRLGGLGQGGPIRMPPARRGGAIRRIDCENFRIFGLFEADRMDFGQPERSREGDMLGFRQVLSGKISTPYSSRAFRMPWISSSSRAVARSRPRTSAAIIGASGMSSGKESLVWNRGRVLNAERTQNGLGRAVPLPSCGFDGIARREALP